MTDETGMHGAGFASVTALSEEELLEPTDALDTLSGFLGAMLGHGVATELLTWLAGHLGDDYAETRSAGATIATSTEAPDAARASTSRSTGQRISRRHHLEGSPTIAT